MTQDGVADSDGASISVANVVSSAAVATDAAAATVTVTKSEGNVGEGKLSIVTEGEEGDIDVGGESTGEGGEGGGVDHVLRNRFCVYSKDRPRSWGLASWAVAPPPTTSDSHSRCPYRVNGSVCCNDTRMPHISIVILQLRIAREIFYARFRDYSEVPDAANWTAACAVTWSVPQIFRNQLGRNTGGYQGVKGKDPKNNVLGCRCSH